jgi:hypothetical protein
MAIILNNITLSGAGTHGMMFKSHKIDNVYTPLDTDNV